MNLNLALVAIIITLFIIIGAVATRRCVECMIIGSMVAAIFVSGTGFLTTWSESLQNMLAENVWVMLVCLLFGGFISLLTDSKGSFGFSKYISKFCNSEKKTLMTTFVMGILIFVDDYLNVLSIGACMKKISDKQKLPRESLAYILDSTGAPVCVLLPFSTWAVFYASLFYEQESVQAISGVTDAMSAYVKAIPFCFYPIVALIVVFLFAMGWMPKLGAMKKAYKRVEETGKVYSDASRKYNHDEYEDEEDGNIWNFLIPMGVLVGVAVVTGDILVAVIIALIICFVMYVPRRIISVDGFLSSMIRGFGDMLPTLTMLLVTFVLKDISGQMGMTEYIIELAEPFLFATIFPAMVFLLGAILAFTTGSDWGMSSIITPIVFPLGAALGANPVLIMAAIISGGTFGSHACFYADATLLASQSSGVENMEHALTQFPYVIIASVISVACFVVAGFVV
ncbi:MAG: Na+/H+ antiporter NhaC family protein [bacterium]|nr:Na+/H+ antiporter NhaC family protein [bacterium]MDY4098529.1 Na+/H+ antiporter NhaC family protein [Lachnospiraceae bacterium]